MYASKWSETECRNFTAEEIAAVQSATVVASQYGNSVCFFMKAGGQTYIPLSRNASLAVGDAVDVKKVKLLTLHRDGSDDITRIDI